MDLKILSTTVNDVFLSPQVRSENETPEDTEPAIVQIIIQLSIPAKYTPPSKLISLSASLVGYESLGFPKGGFEQNQPYYNKKIIDSAADLKLEAGSIYQFEVSFSVDHSTAPYQRCKYGRHHQKVQVKATFPGLLGKKTLMAEKNLFFIQTVATTGFLPYYHVHRSAEEGLGPIFLGVRTQHLTVGGYLRITFSLDSPSPTLQLHSLKMSLLQQTTLKSRIRRNYMEYPPSERFVFFEAGPEELKGCLQHSADDGGLDGLLALAKEQQQQQQQQADGASSGSSSHPTVYTALQLGQCNWVARIPNDAEARASTLPGSDCAIQMAHALELTIQYSDPSLGNSDVRTYRASWGLILPSCACRWQTMRLPSYTPEDANPVPKISRDFWAGRNEQESFTQCVCGEDIEHLLEMERQAASESEIQASSEIWREMLSHRLQQRLLRNGFGARSSSSSSSPALSRMVSRRGSMEDVSSPPGYSGPSSSTSSAGTRDRGRQGRATPPNPPSRTNSSTTDDGVRFGLIEAEDEIEFEMQAREVLRDLNLNEHDYEREWDRLNEMRQRRNKARNEYTSVPQTPREINERRHRSQSAHPALRFFQKRSASSAPSRSNSRPPSPPTPSAVAERLGELGLDDKK
ncbi:uncharacterized protein UTRI_02224_B [Ustilago trichophora]|uniref:Arrestin-like N-terminal domain-containing protein n=1 Tax=Ustilago trichophora TaxID=86804 RepID=A0A5C3DYC6_9BASI|nr:uncharacterized protein UTRI_02224_B [Ustilago trichophora]